METNVYHDKPQFYYIKGGVQVGLQYMDLLTWWNHIDILEAKIHAAK